jgi:hypothetical protein
VIQDVVEGVGWAAGSSKVEGKVQKLRKLIPSIAEGTKELRLDLLHNL